MFFTKETIDFSFTQFLGRIQMELLLVLLQLVEFEEVLIHIEYHQILIRDFDTVLILENIETLEFTVQNIELGLQFHYFGVFFFLFAVQ